MIKKFKKRFRTLSGLSVWALKHTTLNNMVSCDVKYFITKSRDGKKYYYHYEGTYTPRDKESIL